jgi:molybdenum cofactor cytidylyltransferase
VIAGLILAGGESRRMGRPKLMLEHQGVSLLSLVAQKALSVCPVVYGVVGAYSDLYAPLLRAKGVEVIVNADWQEGLASSLRAGVAAMPPEVTAVLVMLADQPFVSQVHLQRLCTTFHEGYELVFSCYKATEGAPAVIAGSLFNAIQTLSGDVGARKLKPYARAVTCIPLDNPADIDTPQDVARFLLND